MSLRLERDRVLALLNDRDDTIEQLETDLKTAKNSTNPLKKQISELTQARQEAEVALHHSQEQSRRDIEEIEALRKQVADRDQMLRKNAELLSRFNDLQDQSKEDKESIGSIKRERDRLMALVDQTEARIVELEDAAKREKADSISLKKQLKDVAASHANCGRDKSMLEDSHVRERSALEEQLGNTPYTSSSILSIPLMYHFFLGHHQSQCKHPSKSARTRLSDATVRCHNSVMKNRPLRRS